MNNYSTKRIILCAALLLSSTYATHTAQNVTTAQKKQTQTNTAADTYNLKANVHEVTSAAELDSILQQKRPIIIYFYASWCTPCTEIMKPAVEEAARQYGNRVSFVSVDFEKFKAQAEKLGVDGLPRMIFRKNGTSITQKGARPARVFLNSVKLFLDNKLQAEEEISAKAAAPKTAQARGGRRMGRNTHTT